MRIVMRGKNVDLTPALKEYAEQKLQKLSRYFDRIDEASVTESVERNWHIVDITVSINGMILRSEERSDDMYVSVDLAIDKLERQLKRLKKRLQQRSRRQRGARAESPIDVAPPETSEPLIVRRKRFNLKPMTPEEAALQMDLLDHSFYVFTNSETNDTGVIYRRNDGNYGLIEADV